MEEKFKKILEDHGIYFEDVTEVLYAVCEMFELMAEETKRDYPLATKAIEQYRKVAVEVSMLTAEL